MIRFDWDPSKAQLNLKSTSSLSMMRSSFLKIPMRYVVKTASILLASKGGRPHERKSDFMKRIVQRTLSSNPLTPARKKRLQALALRPDSEIDLSDIPELTPAFFKNAVRNPFYRPVKQQLTVRLDSDVVAWLRQKGKGYQTRLNQVMREAMIKELRKNA